MNVVRLPIIDQESCTLCAECVDVCPQNVLVINDNELNTQKDHCILCTHCYAICPSNALRFDESIIFKPDYKSFTYKENYTIDSRENPSGLVNLFRSRRSNRSYLDKKVDKKILEDLINFGVTAPSGSNMQKWEFTVLDSREKVFSLAEQIRAFFKKINRQAENILLRYLTAPFTKGALLQYYKSHYKSVKWAIDESEKGRDLLFWGAPSIIIIHSSTKASTPIEDAAFASYNITLLAHALGLGSCYIGYAVEALNRVQKIKDFLKIPIDHRVHTVLALGYPKEEFVKPALRKRYPVYWL